MEGHVPDEPGHVRAAGDVLRTHEQPSDLPDNDERHLRGSDPGRPCMHLHGRHPRFAQTRTELQAITRRVLERLRRHKLYLKAEKCEFEREQVEYLGLIISHDRVGNGSAKGGSGNRMASPEGPEGGAVVSRVRKLLPTVHREVFPYRPAHV